MFETDSGAFCACRGLSFVVHAGETVAIVGETGCGKSTTLAMVLGLQTPSTGTVRVLGLDPFARFDALRGRVGIVFQNDRLLPWRTALENVAFGLEILHLPKEERHRRALAWLERVGLAQFVNSYPHQLSGGMRQRVSIARTFAIEPPLLLADEAFSALDELTAASLRRDLLGLIEETNKTTLFITHSVPEAASLAGRVLVLGRPGHVVHEIDVARMLAEGRSRHDAENEVRLGLQLARDAYDGSGDFSAAGRTPMRSASMNAGG
ncbi:MAG: ABC transporter ATP-binding protein [Candidimonas sp.]|nr:MAG: ABC transporter ATP-binding protein [Candidimonas sp.]